MKIEFSSVLAVIFLLASTRSLPPCKEVVYDHYLLALTWPNEFCSQNYCVRDWMSLWDGKSLIIHGLWPASTDLAYVTCLKQNDHDPYCHEPYTYDDYVFTSAEIGEMRKYWAKLSTQKNFWSHEWMRHGTCYLDIVKNKYKSTQTPLKLFKNYYLETVAKARKLNISLIKGKFVTKADLAKQIKVDVNSFYAICGSDDELDQIRICYSIVAEPGQEKLIKCPPNREYSLCSFPIIVK